MEELTKEQREKIELIRKEFDNNNKLKTQKEYEHNINYFKIIKEGVEKVVNYWENLNQTKKKLLEINNPIKYFYWKAYKSGKIDFEDLKKLNLIPIKNYIQEQKEKLKEKVPEEEFNKWKDEYSKIKKIDYYLDANKEYYSLLIDDNNITKIINNIVEIFSKTNVARNTRGGPKKIINFNKLSLIFLFFKDLYIKQNLNKFIDNNSNFNIHQLGGSIAFELEGLYNLIQKDYFITNKRIYDFLRYFKNKEFDYNLSEIELKKDYKNYKETFKIEINNLKKYIDLKPYNLNLLEIEKDNFKENLIADRLIYEFTRKYIDSKNEKINISNKLTNEKNIIEKEIDINIIDNILQNKKQIILYGPPGTGKTYNTKKIIYNWNKKNLLNNNVSRKEIEENYLQLEKEERVKFITFHQSYAYEEFIEGLKPIEGKKKDKLERDYKVENGIFKEFCQKIINDILIDSEIGLKYVENFETAINKLKNEISEKEEIELKTETNSKFKVSYRNGKTFRIKPEISNSEYDYPASIENIKALYFKTKELSEIYNLSYVKSILNYMIKNNYIKENKKKLKNIYDDDLNKKQRKELFENAKPYFLIIDEINRGNISKIFGELITLLESNKRLGGDDELIVELPYSKEKFGIPPNLYIIATMNTSDKSIANLDIALRRRFGFVEMLPESKLISQDYEKLSEDNKEYYNSNDKINLNELLETLNKRIEYLLDKDHTIGHSYFMKVKSIDNLKEVFYNEIIPLLEEYFYGDYEKIKLVLGSNFIEEINFDKNLFENNDDLNEDNKTYVLIDYRKKDIKEFEDAIKKIIDINYKTDIEKKKIKEQEIKPKEESNDKE